MKKDNEKIVGTKALGRQYGVMIVEIGRAPEPSTGE
jgi:hypothetical protein